MKPLAVVFDMDGLMFNTEDIYWQVGAEVLQRRGLEFTKELCDAMMGRTARAAHEAMIEWHSLATTWEKLAQESSEVFISLLDGQLEPLPGLLDLLDVLDSAKVPKAIATSSSWQMTEPLLTRTGLQNRFDFILTSDDITHGKPDPEIYLKAAERFGINPGEMLVLEDSMAGCKAAVSSGAFAVAVPGEHSKEHDFGMASLVIPTLADPRLRAVLSVD